MTEEERLTRTSSVQSFMMRLADWLEDCFPHQSAALRQELGKPRMNTDRWNRVACVLSSLHSIPGVGLNPHEHDVRNVALSAIVVAQKMAASGLGCTRDPEGCMGFAVWLTAEIGDRMTANE